MGQIMREGLSLFGVKPEQIVEIDRGPALFERLLYPLPVASHPWAKSPNAVAVLESLPDRIGAARDGPKRIYVTRNAGATRRLTNEDAVLDVLRPLGFVVVDPGRLSFAEQIRLFAGAERIVGNCGAGLANLVFAPRGVRVFALTMPFMQDDFSGIDRTQTGTFLFAGWRIPGPRARPEADFRSTSRRSRRCWRILFERRQPRQPGVGGRQRLGESVREQKTQFGFGAKE